MEVPLRALRRFAPGLADRRWQAVALVRIGQQGKPRANRSSSPWGSSSNSRRNSSGPTCGSQARARAASASGGGSSSSNSCWRYSCNNGPAVSSPTSRRKRNAAHQPPLRSSSAPVAAASALRPCRRSSSATSSASNASRPPSTSSNSPSSSNRARLHCGRRRLASHQPTRGEAALNRRSRQASRAGRGAVGNRRAAATARMRCATAGTAALRRFPRASRGRRPGGGGRSRVQRFPAQRQPDHLHARRRPPRAFSEENGLAAAGGRAEQSQAAFASSSGWCKRGRGRCCGGSRGKAAGSSVGSVMAVLLFCRSALPGA